MNDVKNTNTKTTDAKKNEIAEIDLIPIFMALLKKAWLIILAALVVGAGFFAGTKFLVTPTYRASFTAYVNNRSQYYSDDTNRLTSSDLSAAQELVRAYSKIITSRTVLTTAADTINYKVSYSQLSSMVSTSVENETGIITVYVVGETPKEAYELALATAEVAPVQIADIIEGSSMKIIDTPRTPTGIYKPSYIKNTILGMFTGAAVAALYIVIRQLVDDKIKSEDALEAKFSIPVVGVIPDMNAGSKHGGYYKGYYYNYSYGYYGANETGGKDGE